MAKKEMYSIHIGDGWCVYSNNLSLCRFKWRVAQRLPKFLRPLIARR